MKAVQEGNIQWESRTYPYPGTPITQRFSHSKYCMKADPIVSVFMFPETVLEACILSDFLKKRMENVSLY
jgi:hypothetical protein